MLLPLELPPGAFRNGTEYQSAGRFYDMNLCRWIGRALAPIGGWRAKTASIVTGKARAVMAWKSNSQVSRAVIGTHSNWYVMGRNGALTDITPAGFTAGSQDSTLAGGYGSGTYGAGTYGTPRPDTSEIQEADVWTLDHLGQLPVGCMQSDGKIYSWDLNTANDGVRIANSPLACGCFVTNERNVVALGAEGGGAGGTIGRRVAWSDGEDPTIWTAAATNTAGDIDLQTPGALKCGKRLRGVNLVWTDYDVWTMRPTGDQLIYGFDQVGTACGVISKQAVVVIDDQAVWMGKDNFWLYNGAVAQVPCEVYDYVYNDLNKVQGAKVSAMRLSQHNEVWWFYPSAAATENDRYVAWNHETGTWHFGQLSRSCGTDKTPFLYPLALSASGAIYEHEVGFDYGGATPFAQGGPLELGGGDRIMRVTALIPDEATSGQVTASFVTRLQPNGTQSTHGPYTLASKTAVRFSGRQASVKYQGAAMVSWRVGAPRLDINEGGYR